MYILHPNKFWSIKTNSATCIFRQSVNYGLVAQLSLLKDGNRWAAAVVNVAAQYPRGADLFDDIYMYCLCWCVGMTAMFDESTGTSSIVESNFLQCQSFLEGVWPVNMYGMRVACYKLSECPSCSGRPLASSRI